MIDSYIDTIEFAMDTQHNYYFYPRNINLAYDYMQNHGPKLIGKPSSVDDLYDDILIDLCDQILSEGSK